MNTKLHNQGVIRKLYNQPSVRMTTSLLFSIVISMVFFLFAIRPTVLTITNLKKQLKDDQQVLSLMKQKAQALQMAENSYYQAQPYFSYLDQAIPESPEIAKFNAQLAHLVNKDQVQLHLADFSEFDLINNQPAEESRKKDNQIINFTLNFTSTWSQTKTFISDLENFERLISVKQVNHGVDKNNNSQESLINTTLQGQIYYYP